MSALARTTQPGHGALRQRVEDALARCHEERDIDFKQSAPWSGLKAKLVRHCLAMANLRDGGIIVVGVREDGDRWDSSGITKSDLLTFNPDVVQDELKKFASSAIRTTFAVHEQRDGKEYLIIHVHTASELPIVCTRNGSGGLVAGGFFVRPADGRPRSQRVESAEDMREVLLFAAERLARRLVEQARRIGALESGKSGVVVSDAFDAELGDLRP